MVVARWPVVVARAEVPVDVDVEDEDCLLNVRGRSQQYNRNSDDEVKESAFKSGTPVLILAKGISEL